MGSRSQSEGWDPAKEGAPRCPSAGPLTPRITNNNFSQHIPPPMPPTPPIQLSLHRLHRLHVFWDARGLQRQGETPIPCSPSSPLSPAPLCHPGERNGSSSPGKRPQHPSSARGKGAGTLRPNSGSQETTRNKESQDPETHDRLPVHEAAIGKGGSRPSRQDRSRLVARRGECGSGGGRNRGKGEGGRKRERSHFVASLGIREAVFLPPHKQVCFVGSDFGAQPREEVGCWDARSGR